MAQGSNFSRVPMANKRQKFDDFAWGGSKNSGSKSKKAGRPDGKFDPNKEARRNGNVQKHQTDY